MWQYIIVAAIVGWALYYVWTTFARRKGCGCGSDSCNVTGKKNTAPHKKGHPGCCSGQATLEKMSADTPRAQHSELKGRS